MLATQPLAAAVLYSVVASFPLFFAGGFAIRIQADLDLTTSRFGLAASAYFATSAIGSITIGGLVDRRGARAGFVAAGVGAAVASGLVAVAPSVWSLAAGLGVAGLANTGGQLAANRMLAGVDGARQGLGFGIKQAAVPLGSLVAGLIVGGAGDAVQWRAAFAAYAVVALTTTALAPGDEQPDRRPAGDRPDPGTDPAGDRAAGPAPDRAGDRAGGRAADPADDRAVGEAAARPRVRDDHGAGRVERRDRGLLAALAAAGALGGATGNGLAVLVVDALGTAGFSEAAGATALAVGSAIAVVTRIAIGWRAGHRRTSGFGELAAALAVGAVGFGVLAAAGADPVLLWLGASLGFAGAWGWPGVMYFAVVRNTISGPGAATGVVVAGVFLGGIVGTPTLAAVADHWSYDRAWVVAAGTTLVAVGLVAVAARLANRSGGATPERHRELTG